MNEWYPCLYCSDDVDCLYCSASDHVPGEGEQESQQARKVGQAAQLGDRLRGGERNPDNCADDANEKREVDREVVHAGDST